MTAELRTTDHQIDIPLMERKVCHGCGHLHRVILIRKCDCCAADKARWDAEQEASLNATLDALNREDDDAAA